MGWARLDDGFHDHPKVDALSLAAVGLYTLCLTWANRHRRGALVPGHITEARVRKVAGDEGEPLALELVAVGLWEIEDGLGGYLIHDFADYLPKERDPSERREAGMKGAARRWEGHSKQHGKPDGNLPPEDMAKGMASDSSRASAPAYPSRPDPTQEITQVGGERHEPLRAVAATNPPQCSNHPNGDHDGPCAGCKRVREYGDRVEAEHRKSLAVDVANCPDCHGSNWLEDEHGKPAGRCHHRRAS